MLFSTLVVAAAAFSGFATAQNASVGPCCTVDSNRVPQNLKDEWCTAERNTCPEICGGIGNVTPSNNSCDQSTLKFTCQCKNGTQPDMTLYAQSVPGLMCRFWFDLCNDGNVGNQQAQYECKSERDSKCGNLTTNGAAVTSSAASSTTPGPSSTSGGAPASKTVTSTSSSAAATALVVAREFGTPLLAGGMAALFGFVL